MRRRDRADAPPRLVLEDEQILPCGYAPRALIRSRFLTERLFVGCKDGSLAVVRPDNEGQRFELIKLANAPIVQGPPRSIRALCELDENQLLVGRSNGDIEVFRWKEPPGSPGSHEASRSLLLQGQDAEDAVGQISWLGPDRLLVSSRRRGTLIFQAADVREALRAAAPGRGMEGRSIALLQADNSALRLAVRRQSEAEQWLFATSRGGIWHWDGTTSEARPVENIWPSSEEPGFVYDFAVMAAESGGPAQAIFLSTEIGVYFVDFRPRRRARAVRLALPRFGAVCMALTYTATDRHGFLWAADSRGDSHLFWKEHRQGPPAFRPSGIVHVGSQVMLAVSWQRADGSLVFAQARRNDSMALVRYEIPSGASGSPAEPSSMARLRRYRHLLRSGTLEDLRREVPPDPERPSFALLADFFELLAGSPDGLRALQEFLSNPSAEIAREILAGLQGRNLAGEIERAIRLWLLTLLGIVNRMPGERETSYLGIIRWVRDLESSPLSHPELRRALSRTVQRGIRFARKWGLFGEANARRNHLTGPLKTLRAQLLGPAAPDGADARWPEGIEVEPEALDLLTYEALLFHRRFDVLLEDESSPLRGKAQDLSTIEVRGRTLIAVSWIWGGIELFELRRDRDGQLEFGLLESGLSYEHKETLIKNDKPFHRQVRKKVESRAVLFIQIAGRCFLVAIADVFGREQLIFWEISPGEDQLKISQRWPDIKEDFQKQEKDFLEKNEAVYCLLDLEDGQILAGLRGVEGAPRVALFKAQLASSDQLSLQKIYVDSGLPSPLNESAGAPQGPTSMAATRQNPVRALACAKPWRAGRPSRHRIAIGCEGGQILLLTLPRGAGLETAARECRFDLVAQMSSPVVALTYFHGYPAGGAQLGRIFAGGTDGSIVAWQELPGRNDQERPLYASLWATVEQGPIAAIHPSTYGPPGSSGEPIIIAITQAGRCVVFDDRLDIVAPSEEDHPHRPSFPGDRMAHPKLLGTAFASRLIETLPPSGSKDEASKPVWDGGTGRYAVLLTASEHGRLRLISLHYAGQRPARTEQYLRVIELWWRIVRREASVESFDRLRLADAAYQAVPLLPLILVQWLLDPSWPKGADAPQPDAEKLPTWQMPLYLRKLLDLRRAWDGIAHPGRPLQEINRFANPDGVKQALEILLRDAWRLNDLELFQQLCTMALKRANFDLFRQATDREPGASDRLRILYERLLEVIEDAQKNWLSAPERRESRARMIVAKALIDGDTFWRVLHRAAREQEDRRSASRPFLLILEQRIAGASRLVFTRDPLVSLETLRALNLSLMRLCKRLVKRRDEDGGWKPQRGWSEQEAYWPLFSRYFQELTYAAARAFRSRLDLNDSIAHEYCRTFALAVCACPSATIRIANRMTETQLISDPKSEQDLSRRVLRQFDVLAQIGIPVPPGAIELFKIASCPPEKELDPLQELDCATNVDDPADPRLIEKIGVENTEDLYCLCRLYRVVNWIVDLARKLSTDAREIDLTRETLQMRQDDLEDDKLQEFYLHSASFWKKALEHLASHTLAATSRERIRPEMVLRSRSLAGWAQEQIQELDRRYRDLEIFQPEYPIFREVLARFERAAAEFRQSAAVQKNIVLAVFGHHLLEDLDEHVLELEELAQNLDPMMVWTFRDERRTLLSLDAEHGEARPVARYFAEYLLRRAYHAESIPKNLRSLHGILDSDRSTARGNGRFSIKLLTRSLQDSGWTWEGEPPDKIDAREFQCLSLVLAELDSNHRKYSGLASDERKGRTPKISSPRPFHLEIKFWMRWDTNNVQRLEELKDQEFQELLAPQADRKIPSTGAGLYLANLASSVVGWRLSLRELAELTESSLGTCTFELVKLEER